MRKLRKQRGGGLLSPGAQGKRCDSTDCMSAWHQPRAQLAELSMQCNFAENHIKMWEQMSWNADE